MGCWNATCMVSGLPIFAYDPVVAFAIKQNINNSWGDSCYCSAEAVFITPPLFGEYNDYGGIELSDENSEEELQKINKWLEDKLVASAGNELGVDTDNEYHHFKKSMDVQGWFNDNIERGYAAVRTTVMVHGLDSFHTEVGKAPVTITFIHRKIWDHLIQEHGAYKHYNGTTNLEAIKEQLKKCKPDDDDEEIERLVNEMGMTREQAIQFHNIRKDGILRERHPLTMGMDSPWAGYDVNSMPEETSIQMLLLIGYLEHMRLNIRCQTGQGSQSGELDEHIALYEKAIEIAKAKRESWGE